MEYQHNITLGQVKETNGNPFNRLYITGFAEVHRV